MMMMTLRKSALRPLLSVSVPWSITCSRMLKISGCAFSISSSSSTAVRLLGDRFGQQAALVEADIARRRADQAGDRVALHVLRHVEADQLDAQDEGELPGHLGLADAGRTGEQEGADRLVRLAQARARHLDRRRQRFDRRVLAEDTTFFRSRSMVCSLLRSSWLTVCGGMRAIFAMMSSISALPMVFFCFDLGRMRCAAPASSMTSIALSGR